MLFGVCPQCKNEIDNKRLSERVIVCNHCGWSKPNNSIWRLIHRIHRRNMILLVIFFVAFLFQVRKWDNYFISVIPLQIKSFVGALGPVDSQRLIDICEQRQNFQCIEDVSRDWLNEEPLNKELTARYAEALRLNHKPRLALKQYKNYFTIGGEDLGVAYKFANFLQELGYNDEALQYYEYVLGSKPNTLQVTVLKKYVNLLINTNQFSKAKSVILRNRNRGDNTKYILEDEYSQIKAKRRAHRRG